MADHLKVATNLALANEHDKARQHLKPVFVKDTFKHGLHSKKRLKIIIYALTLWAASLPMIRKLGKPLLVACKKRYSR